MTLQKGVVPAVLLLAAACSPVETTDADIATPRLDQRPHTIVYERGGGSRTTIFNEHRRSRRESVYPTGRYISVVDLVEGRLFSWNTRDPQKSFQMEPMRKAPADAEFYWQGGKKATPGGPCSAAGIHGTHFSRNFRDQRGVQFACISDDGVILYTGLNGEKHEWAVDVQYGPHPASLFDLPDIEKASTEAPR